MTVETPTGRLPPRGRPLFPGCRRRAEGQGLDPAAAGSTPSLAGLIGTAVVWYVFGGHILPPSHTGWMLTGTIGPDPVQYWLGFTVFKRSPWMWPPGLNPAYGLELGSSIFYADAIPLLAFLFKALHPVLEISQYWGLWLFACGALQGVLAWRLLGLATGNRLARLAGAALFVMQPTLLNRMGGHFALSAHFLLLAGLWLCLSPGAWPRRTLLWAGLVLLASLIHSYLLPMVLGLWAADWLARAVVARQRRPAPLAAEAVSVPLSGLAGLWAAGFFVLRTGHGGEGARFGEMQLDLLAPFDPSFWGAFLPDLPNPDHLEVGSSYAGLGILLLLLAAGLAWLRRPLRGLAARWPLLLALARHARGRRHPPRLDRRLAGDLVRAAARPGRARRRPPLLGALPVAPRLRPACSRRWPRSRTGSAGAAPAWSSPRWSSCSSPTCNPASRASTASSPSAPRWRRSACPIRSGPRPRATTAASA